MSGEQTVAMSVVVIVAAKNHGNIP